MQAKNNTFGKKKVVRIGLVTGGSGKVAASDFVRCDVELHLDVSKELEVTVGKAKNGTNTPIIRVPLAPGLDSPKLVAAFKEKSGWEEICRVLVGSIATVDTGLMQISAFGTMAYHLTDMREPHSQVIQAVRAASNSSPSRIIVYVFGSVSGGTGGGIMKIAAINLVGELKKHFPGAGTITIKYIVLGATTFDQMPDVFADQIRPNNSIRLVNLMERVIKPVDGELHMLQGYELPSDFGTETALRARAQALILQAMMADEVEAQIDLPANNASAHRGPLGRMLMSQTGYTLLDASVDPRACFASSALNDLHAIAEESEVGEMPKISVTPTIKIRTQARHAELKHMLVPASAVCPEDVMTEYVDAKYSFEVDVLEQLADAPVSVSGAFIVDVPESLDLYRRAMKHLRALLKALEAFKITADDAALDAEENAEETRKEIETLLQNIAPKGPLEKVAAMFANRGKALDRLEDALEEYARLEKSKVEKTAIKYAINDAIEKVKATIDRYVEYVKKTYQWLSEAAKIGAKGEFFTYHPLDDFFAELLAARIAENEAKFASILERGVKGMTTEGLAALLKMESMEIPAIVNKLQADTEHVSAEWSGKNPTKSVMSLYVLPRMDSMLFETLRSTINNSGNGKVFLCQTDSLAGGIGFVRIEMFVPISLKDAMGAYMTDYNEAQNHRRKLLMASEPNLFTFDMAEQALKDQEI